MTSQSVMLDFERIIKELDQEQTYNRSGINECSGIQCASMKEKIRKECYSGVLAVLKSERNTPNKVLAKNIPWQFRLLITASEC